jgi:protein required for attachment to host cells
MAPRTSPKEHEAAVFAKELAAEIEAGRTRNEMVSLVIMAAPSFLGLLKSELSEAAQRLVVTSIHKDLVKSSLEEIRKHLPDQRAVSGRE